MQMTKISSILWGLRQIAIHIYYLGDGNHFRIVKSYSNKVKTHNVMYIILIATGKPVAKTLIKYNNSNNWRKMMIKRISQLI